MTWRDYVPTAGERGTYEGPLSTYAEWHALGVGLAVGILPQVRGHVRDALKELGYLGAGVAIGILVRRRRSDG